jgi:hypothetical protein
LPSLSGYAEVVLAIWGRSMSNEGNCTVRL